VELPVPQIIQIFALNCKHPISDLILSQESSPTKEEMEVEESESAKQEVALKEEDKFGTVMLDLSQPAEVIPVAVPYYW
jgi:hypothetical protein